MSDGRNACRVEKQGRKETVAAHGDRNNETKAETAVAGDAAAVAAQQAYRPGSSAIAPQTDRVAGAAGNDCTPKVSLVSSDISSTIAEQLRDGKANAIVRVEIENEFKKAFSAGGKAGAENLRNEVNGWLKANSSNFRLESGQAAQPDSLRLQLSDKRNGKTDNFADINLKEGPGSSVAEGIADLLKNPIPGGLEDTVLLENAFKEAYKNGGATAVGDLILQINDALRSTDSSKRMLELKDREDRSVIKDDLRCIDSSALVDKDQGKNSSQRMFELKDREDRSIMSRHIKLDSPQRPPEAGGIADCLKGGTFNAISASMTKDAFKQAFQNEGPEGVKRLLNQVNEQLKPSPFSLVQSPAQDGSGMNFSLKDNRDNVQLDMGAVDLTAPYAPVKFDINNPATFMPAQRPGVDRTTIRMNGGTTVESFAPGPSPRKNKPDNDNRPPEFDINNPETFMPVQRPGVDRTTIRMNGGTTVESFTPAPSSQPPANARIMENIRNILKEEKID